MSEDTTIVDTNPAPEKPIPDSISLTDLQLLLQIVDLASQRGAFRGAELTQVGGIFDKLNAFLTYIAEQQKARAEEEEQGDAEAAADQE